MSKIGKNYRIIARLLVEQGVRNSAIEDLHAGTSPSSEKGDFSDVKVVSPYGEIPWVADPKDEGREEKCILNGVQTTITYGPRKVSRISDEEMRELMLDIEYSMARTLRFLEKEGIITIKSPLINNKRAFKHYFETHGVSWDVPGGAYVEPEK